MNFLTYRHNRVALKFKLVGGLIMLVVGQTGMLLQSYRSIYEGIVFCSADATEGGSFSMTELAPAAC